MTSIQPSIGRFFKNLEQHTRILIGGIVVVLSVGIVFSVWSSHHNSQAHSARNALYLAEKSFEEEMKAFTEKYKEPEPKATGAKSAKAAKTGESDASLRFRNVDVDAQFPETVKKLKALDHDFGSARAAFDARLKLASIYFQHGEYEKALSWYQKASGSSPGKFEKAFALVSLGNNYENLGKTHEALQAFEKGLQVGESSLKGELLLAIARCHESAQDKTKAQNTYDQILKDLPNTEYSKSAEIFKSQL